jgi:hypothetical protein
MDEEELWVPLVDEPIGEVVSRILDEDPEVAALVASPKRQLAFRTFAYIRVGLVLGQLLVDHDVSPDASKTWVEDLLADPKHYETVAAEVKAVAREVAADPKLADELGPDREARERVRRFMNESLGGDEAA